MTIKQALTLRGAIILLCIVMLALLGQKAFRIEDKIQDVREAGRLYAAGDLIAAESAYRIAADNSSIHYKEALIAARLKELAPITEIRTTLSRVKAMTLKQTKDGDFPGFMESYASVLSLKAKYMKTGSSYESYYRQLSEDSGISQLLAAGFQAFRKQFLAELADRMNASGSAGGTVAGGTDDSFKWNLLLIPDAYYGSAGEKAALLAERFAAYDTALLKTLAGAGSFQPLLDSALSLSEAYKMHDYDAAWVQKQTEESVRLILGKDLEGDQVTAFAGHAAAYRKYASAAGIGSSKSLTYIESNAAKLLRRAARWVTQGKYADGTRLYAALSPLQDTSAETAAAKSAWDEAEPVRLLPGGTEKGKYSQVAVVRGRYGAKVAVAGIDSSGQLYYAEMSGDGTVTTQAGDMLADAAQLRQLRFDDRLSAYMEVPVVIAETGREDGRIAFTGYAIRPEGISRMLAFAGDGYALNTDDGSITVTNAALDDGTAGPDAVYRETDGVYQFAEIVQDYPLTDASLLEQLPFENISLYGNIYTDSSGQSVLEANGRSVLLKWNTEPVTDLAAVSGQFQSNYGLTETEYGLESVPIFVVDQVGSLNLQMP